MRTDVYLGKYVFEIRQYRKGRAVPCPNPVVGGWVYKHYLRISNDKGQMNFVFFGSVSDYMKGKDRLDAKDLVYAAYCIFNDAIAGYMPFEEFKREYEYDDEREARRVWRACRKVYDSIRDNLRYDIDDLYEIVNLMAKYEL